MPTVNMSPKQHKSMLKHLNDAVELAGGVRPLAREIGAPSSLLSRVRNGRGQIGPAVAIKLAKYLNVELCDIRPDLFE